MSAAEEYRAAVTVLEGAIAECANCNFDILTQGVSAPEARRRLDAAVRALIALGIQKAIGREGDPMTWEPTLAAELLPKE